MEDKFFITHIYIYIYDNAAGWTAFQNQQAGQPFKIHTFFLHEPGGSTYGRGQGSGHVEGKNKSAAGEGGLGLLYIFIYMTPAGWTAFNNRHMFCNAP